MKQFLITISFSFLFWPVCSSAQTDDGVIHLSLNAAYNFNKNEFHNYWSSTPGAGFEFSIEHNIGEIGAGLRLMRFNKEIDSAKSFYGVDYYFLYRHSFDIVNRIDFISGFDIGVFEFRFDDDEDIKTSAERVEREFALKIIGGISYSLTNSWKAELTASYQHIYTRKKIELYFLSFGVTKTFSMPDWMKGFFE